MGDTYSKTYFHLVFAVRNLKALIHHSWKQDLEKYITGIVQNNGHKLIAIGTMPDHIHILVGYNLRQSVPDLVEKIKTSSNHWIEGRKFTQHKFFWQKGYGAFSYSRSQIDSVAKYVLNQEEHHRKKTFKEGYIEIFQKFKIDYKDEYLFDFMNENKE